jgi:arylformamidase
VVIVDLSVPIVSNMIVYPGDPVVSVDQVSEISQDGLQLSRISLGCHAGTHVDAPRHFLLNGGTVDELPIDRFFGPGVRVTIQPGPNGQLDPFFLSSEQVHPGDCLLIHTGWQPQSASEWLDAPSFVSGSARFLVSLGIRLLGIDLPTVLEQNDAGDIPAAWMHQVLLSSGIPIVENLSGLSTLPGSSFEFFAVPLLICGSEASPVRAFARC